MRGVLRWWPPVIAAGILVFALTNRFWAGEEGKMDQKAGEKIAAGVRTVINQGADLFNQNRDFAGCYRLYQGCLLTLRGMLDGHPDLQKKIDARLAEAERSPNVAQRALTLRRALGDIYDKFKPKTGGTERDKGGADKEKPADKVTDTKPADKDKPADKVEDKKPADKDKPADKGEDKDKPADKGEDKPKDKDKASDKIEDKAVPKDLKDVKKEDK